MGGEDRKGKQLGCKVNGKYKKKENKVKKIQDQEISFCSTYVCVLVYLCMCNCMYLCMCTYACVCWGVCMRMFYKYACAFLQMHGCVCVCMYMGVHVRVCVPVCVLVSVCMFVLLKYRREIKFT